MKTYAGLAIVLVLPFLLLSSLTVEAQGSESSDPHSAVSAELIAGTLAGAASGVAGAYLFAVSCVAHAEGWAALACFAAAALGYIVGVPVGSVVGVNVAGSLSGVRGNFLLSVLGGIGGGAVGLGFAGLLAKVFDGLPESASLAIFLGVVPFLSSAGATLGYNVGAQMVASSTEAAHSSGVLRRQPRALIVP